MLEVRHVGTESYRVLAFQRKSRERRLADAGCRAESRLHCATREEGPVRDVPVIAIVDDDQSFREALERFLGTFAFRVRTFASGGSLSSPMNWGWSGAYFWTWRCPE